MLGRKWGGAHPSWRPFACLEAPQRRASMATEAYCVKCRAKKVMKDETEVTMKNGKPATQGTCPDCGTKMFKIGKSK
jgi:hypothetical protein